MTTTTTHVHDFRAGEVACCGCLGHREDCDCPRCMPVTPDAECPHWCGVEPGEHAADAADGSSIVHRGVVERTDAYVVELTEDVEGPALVYVYPDPDHDLSVADARAMAAAVLRACDVAAVTR